MSKVLVFFPTYNEAGNVHRLIETIRQELSEADILVVDDASPDGTGEILDALAAADPKLSVIHRPGKLGLGSAHKIAMMYARDRGYDALITMDADFSHPPRYLKTMLEKLRDADFVTGSRYVAGGVCDYGFGRKLISRTANLFAKAALGLALEENTTMYRGFTRSLLQRMRIEDIRSEGYSFAVESLHQVSLVTDRISEFPIHFEHRAAGRSKISQAEIYKAMWTIQRLIVKRVLRAAGHGETAREPSSERVVCCLCGSTHHSLLYPARNESNAELLQDVSPYSCATHSSRSHGNVLKCLNCGLIFLKPRLSPAELVREYANAEDPVYLEHIDARVQTFRYNFEGVRSHIRPSDRVLEVGSYCGAFLKVMREEGIDITGVEPSAWAVQASKQLSDAPVIRGTTDDVPRDAGKFDVIAAWDVLEHFANPLVELRKMRELLDDEGKLLFSTLMIDNWFPQAMGKNWPWLMDMHLFYFTEQTIRQLLAKAGFELVESRKYCHIVTVEYLFSKLGTLGVPLASAASQAVAGQDWARTQIPFRFGDIKLFVCKKAKAPKAHEVPLRPARVRAS
jgi:SAM-dependent methyltransferase